MIAHAWQPDVGALSRLVALAPGKMDYNAICLEAAVVHVDGGQLRAAEGAGEADEEQHPVPRASETLGAARDQPLDLLRGQRRRRPDRLAVGTADASQSFSDRWVGARPGQAAAKMVVAASRPRNALSPKVPARLAM